MSQPNDVRPADPTLRRRMAAMLALVLISTVLGSVSGAIQGEKTRFFLKEGLHLSATAQSAVNFVTGEPTFLAPAVGALIALFPLFGWRRRGYYVAGMLVSLLGFAVLAMTQRYTLVEYWALISIGGAGRLVAGLVLGGVTVRIGNATGRYAQFVALSGLLPSLFAVAGLAHFGGYVAQKWSYQEMFWVGGVLTTALSIPLVFLIDDQRMWRDGERPATADDGRDAPRRTLREKVAVLLNTAERVRALAVLKQALQAPGLAVMLAYFFWMNVIPSARTIGIYYLSDGLHLSKQAIGDLGLWSGLGGIIASVGVFVRAPRLTPRVMSWGSLAMALALLVARAAIHDAESARWATFVGALCSSLFSAMLTTLTVRACIEGAETAIIGLIAAIGVVAADIADVLGSALYQAFGPAHGHTIAHAWMWTNVAAIGFTALAAGLIPFMPAWARSRQPLEDAVFAAGIPAELFDAIPDAPTKAL
jgi:MFS family permease